eukprot:CAMPEP_0174321766 /NCGR_PEP_ID=MMETSP0810-20121108/10545_1 /TAXON_ID=73025 ORGANISM="Eutreptiella gymnastica-like, Strain CCMP1594" /NCGR_SAMPLE_ID=MMETSP0810 /ASSEMBLY_ACC=CAM_ASM_000659 /LENGTH=38 /DNA_ID= /DNA_START= /DNA_END= /DNA_ORIENTATION=
MGDGVGTGDTEDLVGTEAESFGASNVSPRPSCQAQPRK